MPEAESFIDFANFGMTLPEVRSVAATASYWRSAAREAGMAAGLAADPEALEARIMDLEVKASYTDSQGTAESKTSLATTAVAIALPSTLVAVRPMSRK